MQNKSLFELNCLHTNSSLKRQIIPTNELCRCESDKSEQGFGVAEIMDFNTNVTSIDENPSDLQLSQASSASVRNGLGARVAPRGNCQEDWTGPDDNFYCVPSWEDCRVEQGPRAPQGETLLCRPNKRTTGDDSRLQIP